MISIAIRSGRPKSNVNVQTRTCEPDGHRTGQCEGQGQGKPVPSVTSQEDHALPRARDSAVLTLTSPPPPTQHEDPAVATVTPVNSSASADGWRASAHTETFPRACFQP